MAAVLPSAHVSDPTGPGWRDLLRHAPGTRLRIEVALSAPMRQAIEAVRSSSAGRWLRLVDGAALTLDDVSASGCVARLEGESGVHGEFSAIASAGTGYRLQASLRSQDTLREFECDDVRVQTGGATDAYLAQPVDGGWRPLLRLSHERDRPGIVGVYVCASAMGGRASPAVRALLPAQILVARLRPQA